MPELPEVETVRRGLEPYMTGRVVQTLTLHRANLRNPFPDNMQSRIEGTTCLNLRRRGKYILADLDSHETLVIHLGMSGSFSINPKSTAKHDHVVFTTDRDDALIYNDPRRFGMMFLFDTDKENETPPFNKMGIEPLSNDFNEITFHDLIKTKITSIKATLLDQNIVAGIGNIYACEALYSASISPLRAANTLSIDEAAQLSQAIKTVLNDAIQSGGSTLRDHRQTDGAMGYFQHHFNVYGKEGEKCAVTGDQIIRIVQNGRSTFYSPAKQR